MIGSDELVEKPVFSPAVIGALAHLYRGEVYRSTVWRNRLDATTNWAVVATGIALSVTFSSASASPRRSPSSASWSRSSCASKHGAIASSTSGASAPT